MPAPALSCGEEFPKCLGSWWPTMDFINALHWGPVGVEHNYENITNKAVNAGNPSDCGRPVFLLMVRKNNTKIASPSKDAA
jgi:hypothetical protein